MHGIKDAALYRKLCEPFANRKEAAAAVEGFTTELRALREKHKLPDVTVLISLNYVEAGQEATVVFTAHNGDPGKQLPMIAQAYGAAKKDNTRLHETLAHEANAADDGGKEYR